MTDINPISNSIPTGPSNAPAEVERIRSEAKAQQVKAEQAKAQASDTADQEQRFSIPNYTVRYHVQGKQISVRILDGDGRLVRTVPASELLKALKQDSLAPRVNFLG